MKADKRSESPERGENVSSPSSGDSHEKEEERYQEKESPVAQEELFQPKGKKDRGMEITDEDLKMLKESSQGKKEISSSGKKARKRKHKKS